MTTDIYEQIIDKLIQLVTDGTLKPNDKVYSENRMSLSLGVQRSQVREVYTGLEILGILEGRRGEGTFFKPSHNPITFKVLFLMMLMEESSIEDITQARKIFEMGAAELAAQNRTEEDIKELERCLEVMRTSKDPKEVIEADNTFHFTIGKASGNEIINNMMKIISGSISTIVDENWHNIMQKNQKDIHSNSIEQHADIVDAIKQRKGYMARLLMDNHINDVMNIIYVNKSQRKSPFKSKMDD